MKVSFKGKNNPFYGRHHSEDSKQKQREAHLGLQTGEKNGRSRAIIQIDLKTGQKITEFKTIREASKVTGANEGKIPEVCRGKRKSTGGFGWMYKEDYEKTVI